MLCVALRTLGTEAGTLTEMADGLALTATAAAIAVPVPVAAAAAAAAAAATVEQVIAAMTFVKCAHSGLLRHR